VNAGQKTTVRCILMNVESIAQELGDYMSIARSLRKILISWKVILVCVCMVAVSWYLRSIEKQVLDIDREVSRIEREVCGNSILPTLPSLFPSSLRSRLDDVDYRLEDI